METEFFVFQNKNHKFVSPGISSELYKIIYRVPRIITINGEQGIGHFMTVQNLKNFFPLFMVYRSHTGHPV